MTSQTPTTPAPVGRIWPRYAAAADLTGENGEDLRRKLDMRLELPVYAQQVAFLLGRDSAGTQFTRVLAWPFARHLLDRPIEWWRTADAEPAQPGWPRRHRNLFAITEVAQTFPLFGLLPEAPAAVAFRGDEQAWHQARRAALSTAVAQQDEGEGGWSIRIPETVTPWLAVQWSVPYPARNAPVSRSLAAVTFERPSGGILRGRQTVTIELSDVQSDVAALIHVLVGAARDTSRAAAAGTGELRSLLWRLAHDDDQLVEGDIIQAHRRSFPWLMKTRALAHAS